MQRLLTVVSLLVLCSLGKKVSVKEVVFDSAVGDIQWLGADQKTVLVLTRRGRLYRSTNGGDEWKDISEELKGVAGPQRIDRLVKSPGDSNTIVASGANRDHFITTDKGETWKRIRMRANIHTFMFHKTRPNWALVSVWTNACEAQRSTKKKKEASEEEEGAEGEEGPCVHILYLTKDAGKTFTVVTQYVVQFGWGEEEMKQQDRVYFTHFRRKSGDQAKLYMWSEHVDFAYTDDLRGKNVRVLVPQGNKFLISHGFIFVAKLKDTKSQTVKLIVSNDGGKHFRPASLPQEIDEKSYTVLDTSEGAVMIHVNHASDEPPFNVGNVYISDEQGVRYTLSLMNNVRSSRGECEFDKILSLDGVYMANFRDVPFASDSEEEVTNKESEAREEAEKLEEEASGGTEVDKHRSPMAKAKDESIIRTVISFDKGGVWSYLKPPTVDSRGAAIDCPPDKCWLHLHGITNFMNYAPFYSTENAIGIIMGTGNVGPYLRFEADQVNTYLSRDGGLTWLEAHKGAFIYEYGDHGGLLVMADDVRKTKQVVFSWNEGQSWYDFELSDTPLEVDNIVTEPSAISTKFLLYGTRGDSGVMYHLDFEALGQPLCKGVWAADSVSSDYESWSPSDGRGSEKCILGHQVTYTRRKQTSECFNGEKFERPTFRKNCACTEENFECEVGFTRKVDSLECKFVDDGMIPAPETCTSSDVFYVVGHRKVAGDTCTGGWQPQKIAVPCPANSKLSRGAVSVLGTIFVVSGIMAVVTLLSRSEKFRGYFANYGFGSYGGVKYVPIGLKAPETAMDSVGARFDADFIDNDQDDFDNDAPQLMQYTSGGDDRDLRDRRGDRDRHEMPRRIDTAASQVPKLQKPPGGVADRTEELDLL